MGIAHRAKLFDLRSPDGTGRSFVPLLFLFQFPFFLWIELGLFPLFPFTFIFLALITHICCSLCDNGLRRAVAPKTRLRAWRLADEIV